MSLDYYDENDLRKMGFKSIGKDVRVSKTAIIKRPNEVTIGNHVAIDDYVVIGTKARIGNYVHIGIGVVIFGRGLLIMEDYTFIITNCTLIIGTDNLVGEGLAGPTIPSKYRKITYGTTILKKYSGLATNVTVFPNVTIGEGTLVGACSLVTKSLEPWGIYIGLPVKRLRNRKKDLIKKYAEKIEGNSDE